MRVRITDLRLILREERFTLIRPLDCPFHSLQLLVHHVSNSQSRMNNLDPIDLGDTRTKFRHRPRLMSKKVWIWLLSALIVAVMSSWLAFLGWGLIEALQFLTTFF
jgi:hypothetical protein